MVSSGIILTKEYMHIYIYIHMYTQIWIWIKNIYIYIGDVHNPWAANPVLDRSTKMWMFSQVTLLMTSVPSHAMYLGMAYGWGANPHDPKKMEVSLAVSNKLAMLKWRFNGVYILYFYNIYIYIIRANILCTTSVSGPHIIYRSNRLHQGFVWGV